MAGVRRGAAAVYKFLIALFVIGVIVQFFLAGLGIFGAIPAEGESTSSDRFEDKIGPHAGVGGLLLLMSLLLVILILIAWTGPRSIGATVGLFALMILQVVFAAAGEDAPVVGALHAVNALLVLGLSAFLASRAWRGNLLIPPRDLAARGSTPPLTQP